MFNGSNCDRKSQLSGILTEPINPCASGIIFRKYNFEVSQLKHLTRKTNSLEISNMWSTVFSPSKMAEKIRRFFQMFNISVNFKDTKKG